MFANSIHTAVEVAACLTPVTNNDVQCSFQILSKNEVFTLNAMTVYESVSEGTQLNVCTL